MSNFFKYSLLGLAAWYIFTPKPQGTLNGSSGYEWKKTMSGKEVLSMLKKNGWIVDRIEGSHYICIKNNKTVPVPVHGNKDLKKGTYKKIQKDARNAENS